ncbi:hypothetical protein GCM10009579_65950 [Streptomyces javensis]|uniref:Helicase-associated domain-containing protein n=1 Tax=Streptomyces javensis TaxID=114698 RepID=A0ABN1XAE1_9ACTN
MANLRRKGGLGKDPKRAAARAHQLAAIDPGWNCPWPLDWQRHYRVLADLVDADGALPAIAPGVLFEGDDLGKWLQRQQQPASWAHLSTEQQDRLSKLGVQPAEAPPAVPAPARATKGLPKAQQAFQRGLTALAQWVEREGTDRPVPRWHSEEITVDGEMEPVAVRLGVWVSNTKSRWGKLAQEQQAALAALDVPWAVTAPVPSRPGGPDPAGDVVVQPVPSDASGQECQCRGDNMAEKERQVMERVRRIHELMRNHTKAELLRMAYAGGLVNHNSPEQWRKEEIASAVMDSELRAAARSGASQPPAPPVSAAPAKRPRVRHHHDECATVLYEGGACTCDLIKQYGPPSERDDY